MKYIFTFLLLLATCLAAKAQNILHADTLGPGVRFSADSLYLVLDSNAFGPIVVDSGSGWVTTITRSINSPKHKLLAELYKMYDKSNSNVRKYRRRADAALKKGDIEATIIAQREHNYWIGYHDAVTILINKYQ